MTINGGTLIVFWMLSIFSLRIDRGTNRVPQFGQSVAPYSAIRSLVIHWKCVVGVPHVGQQSCLMASWKSSNEVSMDSSFISSGVVVSVVIIFSLLFFNFDFLYQAFFWFYGGIGDAYFIEVAPIEVSL